MHKIYKQTRRHSLSLHIERIYVDRRALACVLLPSPMIIIITHWVCVHVCLGIVPLIFHFPLSSQNHPFFIALFVYSVLLLILSVLSFLCCCVSSHVQCSYNRWTQQNQINGYGRALQIAADTRLRCLLIFCCHLCLPMLAGCFLFAFSFHLFPLCCFLFDYALDELAPWTCGDWVWYTHMYFMAEENENWSYNVIIFDKRYFPPHAHSHHFRCLVL